MSLYELTLAAQAAHDTYRHPDLGAWRHAIDPVLSAAGQNTVGHDDIASLSVVDSGLHIVTSYSLRGCSMSNDIRLPLSVLTAEDPLRAATRHRLLNELAAAKSRRAVAQQTLTHCAEKVAQLEASLADLDS